MFATSGQSRSDFSLCLFYYNSHVSTALDMTIEERNLFHTVSLRDFM